MTLLDPRAVTSAATAPSTAAPLTAASSSSPAFISSLPTPLTSVHPAQSAANADVDPQTDHDDSEGARFVAVPRCSTWFAMDKINPIEKRMLPEFFTGNASKTAETYLKYRNYMVHAYRQQPGVYLTATACRRNLAGDACAILRVHEFLTHWGLINFHVPPHAMPPAVHSNYALKSAEIPANSSGQGPVAMLVAAKRENARRVDVPLACEACGTARGPEDSFFELTTEAKKKITSNGAAAGIGSATPISTGTNGKTAEGKEVMVGGFALRPGSGICEHCYIGGAFPEGYDAADFVLMPTVAKNLSAAAQWTQEETNLLLEVVSSTRTNQMKGENEEEDGSCDWNLIASKVGTKTADECLLHFLEMPMLNQTIPSHTSGLGNSIRSLRPFTSGEALNAPVLDLAMLVEQVDPLVAKAAAHAAIGAIKRLNTMPAATKPSPQETTVTTETSATVGGAIKVENTPGSASLKPSDASITSLEDAADAVARSAETAGIASTIKSEGASADGDVAMEDVSSATTDSASKTEDKQEAGVPVSKEVIAVTEEAANATTVALLATRAQTIADETVNGPVRDLVNQLLENQLRQMELKIQQLNVLEKTVIAEKEQLAKEKYQLYVDRLTFAQEKLNGRSA